MSEYAPLCIYLVISTLLSLVILSLSFVFSTQKADPEKVSAYECGFDPFDDARARFDIRFYLVAILFIIFDLEVTFLFPWANFITHNPTYRILGNGNFLGNFNHWFWYTNGEKVL
jgi:NADH:ubiquinone oxidoreductase subunit 3 (subunit A)